VLCSAAAAALVVSVISDGVLTALLLYVYDRIVKPGVDSATP